MSKGVQDWHMRECAEEGIAEVGCFTTMQEIDVKGSVARLLCALVAKEESLMRPNSLQPYRSNHVGVHGGAYWSKESRLLCGFTPFATQFFAMAIVCYGNVCLSDCLLQRLSAVEVPLHVNSQEICFTDKQALMNYHDADKDLLK